MITAICIFVILIIIPAALLPITMDSLFTQKELDEMGVIYKLSSYNSDQDQHAFALGHLKVDDLSLSIIKE